MNGGILHWLLVGSAAFGWLGWILAAVSYVELRKWARLCQSSSVAIGFRGKVVMNHTLEEIVGWSQILKRDGLGGQVFYRNNKVSVSVLRKGKKQAKVVKQS